MRYYSSIFLFLLVCSVGTGNAQSKADSLINLAISHMISKEYDPAYEILEKVVIIYHENEQWTEANTILDEIARFPLEPTLVKKFSDFIDQQSSYLKEINPIESSQIHSYIGSWNARYGRFEEAHSKFKYAAERLYILNDTQYLHRVYYWLGQTFQFGKMNGAEALVCANQAERVFNLKKSRDERFIGKLYSLKATAYQSFDNTKALHFLRKTKEVLGDPEGKYESRISKVLTNLKRYDESYESALKASSLYFEEYNEINGEYLANEALILGYLNKMDQALIKINKAFRFIGDVYKPSESGYIKLYFYKAQILNGKGKLDEALENIQKLYTSFYPEYTSNSNTSIPDISKKTPNHWVLNALEEQGSILVNKYRNSKDSKFLANALTSFEKAINDLEVRRKEMDTWESKEQYNQILYQIYEQALMTSARLYQHDSSAKNKALVLSFLDKSKATLLQENNNLKRNRSLIPEQIQEQEKAFQKTITSIETQILKEENEGNIESLKNQLFDTKQELNNFRKKYSEYYFESPDLEDYSSHEEDVQNLPEETLVVSHHIYDDEVLIVSFDNQDLDVTFTSKNVEFDHSVFKIRGLLSDWNSTLSNREGSEDSIQLYAKYISNQLLKPIEKINTITKRIVFMPNGALHNLPYELLPLPNEDQLMIAKYDVSYAYLFSSLPNSKSKENKSMTFAGFAPSYSKNMDVAFQGEEDANEDSKLLALRSGLIDIPEARKSVSSLASKYSGSSWIGDEATKERFINEAQNYDVLHLGMHSLLNENTSSLSSLVFSGQADNELYLREVRSMEIPASLVVLSACNTGVGRNVVGEGPFSLARAFFYAGTKSALMSLWQVPDVQTSRIMQLFYDNLEKGLDKSKALSQAKRDYLKTASVLESHPAFWSGFVLVGDSSPLVLETKVGLLSKGKYLLFALLFSIVLLMVFKKNRKKSEI